MVSDLFSAPKSVVVAMGLLHSYGMARPERLTLPHYPHHIVQRGHNRQVVFAEPQDYTGYLQSLEELKNEYGVKVYAFCLMTNHVHLLLSPSDEQGISKVMKHLAGRQTRRHNTLERRTGSLWEGRFKSSLVDTDAYLLACYRYIELNPVRARMADAPEHYPWSSCSLRFQAETSWLDEHPCYIALGADPAERAHRYRAFLRAAISPGEWQLIRDAVQRGQLTGDRKFIDEIEAIVGRRVERRGQGRPRNKESPGPV
jgi:putative transposase